jgi:hypothetical protein
MKQLALIGIVTYLTFVSVAVVETYREMEVERLRQRGEFLRHYIDKTPQPQQPSVEIRPGMRGA